MMTGLMFSCFTVMGLVLHIVTMVLMQDSYVNSEDSGKMFPDIFIRNYDKSPWVGILRNIVTWIFWIGILLECKEHSNVYVFYVYILAIGLWVHLDIIYHPNIVRWLEDVFGVGTPQAFSPGVTVNAIALYIWYVFTALVDLVVLSLVVYVK